MLDELKRQHCITEDEYAKLNTSLGSGVKTSAKTENLQKRRYDMTLIKTPPSISRNYGDS